LFSNSFKKNIWVVTKKINGKISNVKDGEFKKAKNKVKLVPTFMSLKKSNSVKTFRIKTKLNVTRNTYNNDLRNMYVKNLI
tara:strand:+ start:133 stop:375 length:243 start_codon:yes stop_codon:yes gene_type:complete